MVRDDLARVNLKPLALSDQLVSTLGAAEHLGKPLTQSAGLAALGSMSLNNRVLTRLKCMVEAWRHEDIVRNKPADLEGVFQLPRETRDHDLGPELVSELLNLCDAARRR